MSYTNSEVRNLFPWLRFTRPHLILVDGITRKAQSYLVMRPKVNFNEIPLKTGSPSTIAQDN